MDDSIKSQADYIIIGAGSAGCILAARLSEDPNCKVILVEAGGRDNNPWIHIPVGFSKTVGDKRFDWNFESGPEPGLDGRILHYARGKTLGGSSSINGLAWVTGGRYDYDNWKRAGCDQWGYDEMLPYLQKIETFAPGGDHRGKDGPIHIQYNPGWANSMDLAAKNFELAGVPFVDDYNVEFPHGVGKLQTNVRGGRRMSSATAYLVPARGRPNLEVITNAHVESIAIANGAASGIVIRRGGRTETLQANGEVLLCAGAIGSPVILEMSGIGDPERLKALGVEVKGEAREVGENLKDHYAAPFRLRLRGLQSLNGTDSGLKAIVTGLKYALARSGPLVETPTQLNGFMRIADGEGPSDIQVLGMALSYNFKQVGGRVKAVLDKQPGMSISFYPIYPKSTGSVHAKAGGGTAMVCNFLTDADDQKLFVAGLRRLRAILKNGPLAEYVVAETTPGPSVDDSEDQLLAFARVNGYSAMHPTTTCRMGPDDDSVVDQSLNLRACRRLRVIDASVFPTIPGCNTNAPTLALAERAAEIIKRGGI